jgi:hypothetical protein
LPGRAIDLFPQQVGVAAVAGRFLDHVGEDPAERLLAPATIARERGHSAW